MPRLNPPSLYGRRFEANQGGSKGDIEIPPIIGNQGKHAARETSRFRVLFDLRVLSPWCSNNWRPAHFIAARRRPHLPPRCAMCAPALSTLEYVCVCVCVMCVCVSVVCVCEWGTRGCHQALLTWQPGLTYKIPNYKSFSRWTSI